MKSDVERSQSVNKYYANNLSADRLKAVYDLATARIDRYLEAETKFAPKCGMAWGIDNSLANLKMARDYLSDHNNVCLSCMTAGKMGFTDGCFDLVICIQNGISAFQTSPEVIVREAVRVTRPGGRILLSTYSEKFWVDRLHWSELQSEVGLLGEIDRDATGDGVIVCKDGFKATTFSERQFVDLARVLGLSTEITEIDESSLFCEIRL